MNRKHLLGIGLLSAAMLLTGCSAEILDGHSGQVPIYLTASVQEGGAQGVTRAGTDVQSTQLPNGEEFYGYFPSGATVSNATFTANGSGGTTADPQPYFTFSGTETTVHAYHGKSGGTEQVKETTTSFSVATDQSSDAAYRASDLMYATATVTKSGLSATGNLQFSHKMAKIIVNATLGSGITSITRVKIVGGSKTISIDTPLSCTLGTSLSDDNSSANITVFSGNHSSGTLSCAALIPPQRVPAEGSTATNFLQIETNAGTVTYSLNGKDFASNNVYTFTVTLTASQAGTTVAITDWADNGNATVTVGGGASLALDKSSMTLVYGGNTGSLAISGSVKLSGSGTTSFTATSSDPSVATVAVSGTTITVTPAATGAAVGTTTITVTDGNNNDNTATCLVTVNRPAGALLSEATSGHVGYVVGANGRLYSTLSDLNTDNTTAVGVLAYSNTTGHGYIMSLVNSQNANWDTVNGWTAYSGSITNASGSKKCGALGSLTSYTKLGSTDVSDWVVLTMDQYISLWKQFSNDPSNAYATYNSTSNGYFQTIIDAGGTAAILSGCYYSCTPFDDAGWGFNSGGWDYNYDSGDDIRPVLAF